MALVGVESSCHRVLENHRFSNMMAFDWYWLFENTTMGLPQAIQRAQTLSRSVHNKQLSCSPMYIFYPMKQIVLWIVFHLLHHTSHTEK